LLKEKIKRICCLCYKARLEISSSTIKNALE